MSFVDVPDLGSKITEVDIKNCDPSPIPMICDKDNRMFFPSMNILLAIVYGYQIYLAYNMLADSPNRKLRILKAMLYIPLSIIRTLRFAIGACVIYYLISSLICNNARAPSVEIISTTRNVAFSTGCSSNDERIELRDICEPAALIDLGQDELSEIIIIPDPNQASNNNVISTGNLPK